MRASLRPVTVVASLCVAAVAGCTAPDGANDEARLVARSGGGPRKGAEGTSAALDGVAALPACGELPSGATLGRDQSMPSCDGRFALTMRADGNLVLTEGARPIWETKTFGPDHRAIMQKDGDFVVLGAAGQPRWKSKTDGRPGARLAVQDDRNLVIYEVMGGNDRPVWSSGTQLEGAAPAIDPPTDPVTTPPTTPPPSGEPPASEPPPPAPPPPPTPPCGGLAVGASLGTNASMPSCDGRFVLVMQSDGNLVLYQGGTALWASHTVGSNAIAVMQSDGNLVVYAGGAPIWHSATHGRGGASLAIQDDGNVVIYDRGAPVWATNTCCR